jgi:hypothetical protein
MAQIMFSNLKITPLVKSSLSFAKISNTRLKIFQTYHPNTKHYSGWKNGHSQYNSDKFEEFSIRLEKLEKKVSANNQGENDYLYLSFLGITTVLASLVAYNNYLSYLSEKNKWDHKPAAETHAEKFLSDNVGLPDNNHEQSLAGDNKTVGDSE